MQYSIERVEKMMDSKKEIHLHDDSMTDLSLRHSHHNYIFPDVQLSSISLAMMPTVWHHSIMFDFMSGQNQVYRHVLLQVDTN